MGDNQRLAKLRPGLVLILFLGLVLVSSPTQSLASTSKAMSAVIVQLARELHDSPYPMRSDFAWLSLTQMAEFYTGEAARARRELRHTSRAGDVSSWAAAVEDYARKIDALANSMTTETSIVISVDSTNNVFVYVDGQPVIITGAIGGQQSAYEQRVLERFCILYVCEDLLPELEYSERDLPAIVTETDASTAYWSFSQYTGPVCMTNDGLEFQFQQMSDMGEKRVACTRVVAELSELARAIDENNQQGARVDWDALKVMPAVADEPHRVMLATGVEIRLALPMLAENPELLGMVRPWLNARVRGDTYHLVVLHAERYLGLADKPVTSTVNQRYPAFTNVNPD